MASATRHLHARRRIKKAAQGKVRKNHIRKYGSTAPNLPLDKPNSHEVAQQKAKKTTSSKS